ncbi:MAG: hypothetical protein FWD27_08385, partial [Coriobacteriia bacterium]|nr:hypothetical protein [Coriobacteriia bacterium]
PPTIIVNPPAVIIPPQAPPVITVIPPAAPSQPIYITQPPITLPSSPVYYPPANNPVYVPVVGETVAPTPEPDPPVRPTNIPQPTTPTAVVEIDETWSLVNLISTLLLMLALLIGLLRFLYRPKKDEDERQRNANWSEDRQDNQQDERGTHSTATRVFLGVLAAAGVLTLVLFVLTQNLTLGMTLFDGYSALFISLLVAGLVSAIALFVSASASKAKEDEREQERHKTRNEVAATSFVL